MSVQSCKRPRLDLVESLWVISRSIIGGVGGGPRPLSSPVCGCRCLQDHAVSFCHAPTFPFVMIPPLLDSLCSEKFRIDPI